MPAVCWPRELGVPRWFSCACVSVCSGTDFAPPARPPLDRMGRGLTFGCPSTERQSVQSTRACLEFCCAYGSAPTVTVSRLKKKGGCAACCCFAVLQVSMPLLVGVFVGCNNKQTSTCRPGLIVCSLMKKTNSVAYVG